MAEIPRRLCRRCTSAPHALHARRLPSWLEAAMIRKVFFVPVLALALAATSGVAAQQSDLPALLLEAADQKATVEGNLAGAIRDYEAIVSAYGKTHRPVAAQALLRMAEAYQKMGDTRAPAVYDRIVREFPEQVTAVSTARARLGRLAAQAPADTVSETGVVEREVVPPGADLGTWGSVSRDGRFHLFISFRERGNLVVRDLTTNTTRVITTTPN